MISVRAPPPVGFRKFCMQTGQYDGSRRNHGQRSFLPSFSKSSFSQRITRKPALDFSFRRESLSTFAAWLEEEFAIHGSLSFQMDCPSHPKRKAVRLFYFNPAEHRFCA